MQCPARFLGAESLAGLSMCGLPIRGASEAPTGRASQGKFRYAALLLNRKPVAACLLQYPVDVVFDGLRGKVQLRGNLFVGQALSDHGNQLLFTARQRKTRAQPELGHARRLVGEMREK